MPRQPVGISVGPVQRDELATTYLEDPIDSLLERVLINRLDALSHETVNRDDYIGHFLPCDASVAINVVQGERPPQLLLERAAGEDGQSGHEVL